MNNLFTEASGAYKARRFKTAVDKYRQAINSNPSDLRAYDGLVRALFRLKQYDEAIQICQKAIELNSDLAKFYMLLGSIYRYKGQFQTSQQYLEQAIQLDPNYVDAYIAFGLTCNLQGRFQESEDAYKKALNLDSRNVMASYNLAKVYERQKRVDDAIQMAKRAYEAQPSLQTWLLLLEVYYVANSRLINVINVLCLAISFMFRSIATLPLMLVFILYFVANFAIFLANGGLRPSAISRLFIFLIIILLYAVNLIYGLGINIF